MFEKPLSSSKILTGQGSTSPEITSFVLQQPVEKLSTIPSRLYPRMSVPKTRLIDLHVDCLEPIVSLLSAYDIGHLWQVGDVMLQRLLSDGGAVRKFHYSHETTYPVLWPHLMTIFGRIVEISIQVSVKRTDQDNFAPAMPTLPPNLEKLTLNFENDFSMFKRSYEVNPERYAKLKSLQILCETGQSSELDLSPLEALTQFRLNNGRYRSLVLNHLVQPPNLTDLQISVTKTGLESLLSNLPATVSDLSILTPSYGSIWHRLPRNLLHLYIESSLMWFSPDDLPTDLNDLPPNLETLSVRLRIFNREIAAQLPKTLKELSVDASYRPTKDDLMEIYRLLPETLEGLYGCLRPVNFSSEVAKLLPRRLKSCLSSPMVGALEHMPVGTKTMESPTLEDFPHLVRFTQLTELSCEQFDASCVQYLPRTLQRLDILEYGLSLTLDLVQQLPRTLTYLYLRGPSIDCSVWHALPRGLTTLVLEAPSPKPNVLPEDALQLPPGLTALGLESVTACKAFFANLPTSITKLEISVEENPDWALALPRFTNMQHLMINAYGREITNAKLVLQHLPRRLKIFEWACFATDLQAQHLLLCPPGLQRLKIPRYEGLLDPPQGTLPYLTLQLV